MNRRLMVFCGVVGLLVAAILVRCEAGILTEEAVYDAYPMADSAEQETRRREAKAEKVAAAEKQAVVVAVLAVPVAILLARRKAQHAPPSDNVAKGPK